MDVNELRQTLDGTYNVERELAGGGMSRVFLAEETLLGRRVVIKVLSPDLAAGVSGERFSQEMQLAAQLQQANIVPLLASGVVGGLPYYTMPYVTGESLRARLSSGQRIPTQRALSILRDVARALLYAHERGIIHRDIKPENILLSGDTACVSDFGIAKAIDRSLDHSAHALTLTGTVVGTPAYIAPEQAAGDPVTDNRADLYSFGCLAYELFTGSPPFAGRSPQAVLAAHMTEVPKPLSAVAPDIMSPVAEIITRCLAKSPADRPQSAREILDVLDGGQSSERKGARRHFTSRTIAVAAVALVLIAIVFFVAPTARGRLTGSALGPRAKAVAVLPFTIPGGDSSEAYFAEGMADELIAALGKVPVLSVASRRSAFALKQRNDLDVQSIGRLLHVDAILEGTVRRSGDRLRVTAQLINAADGLTLWSDSYERQMKDVFAVQDDITRSIVEALRLRLGSGQRQVTKDLRAYDDYLRGAYALEQRGTGVAKAVELFNAAIQKDSSFGRAYGKLSEALELMPYFAGVSTASVEHAAIIAANRALSLDSSDADAHVGLGLALRHAFRWQEAEREFRRAIAADSNSAVARTQFGRHLIEVARVPEAIDQFRRAVALDPSSGTNAAWLGWGYALNGDMQRGLAEGAKAFQRFPNLVLTRLLYAAELLETRHYEEAQKLVEPIPGSKGFEGQACYVMARTGKTAEAKALIATWHSLPDTTWLVHTGLAHCYLGTREWDKAIDELDKAFRAREITPMFAPFGTYMYDGIRDDPRFARILHDFGLDEKLFIPPNRGRPGS